MRQAIAQNLSIQAKMAELDLNKIGNDKSLTAKAKKTKLEQYLASNCITFYWNSN